MYLFSKIGIYTIKELDKMDLFPKIPQKALDKMDFQKIPLKALDKTDFQKIPQKALDKMDFQKIP